MASMMPGHGSLAKQEMNQMMFAKCIRFQLLVLMFPGAFVHVEKWQQDEFPWSQAVGAITSSGKDLDLYFDLNYFSCANFSSIVPLLNFILPQGTRNRQEGLGISWYPFREEKLTQVGCMWTHKHLTAPDTIVSRSCVPHPFVQNCSLISTHMTWGRTQCVSDSHKFLVKDTGYVQMFIFLKILIVFSRICMISIYPFMHRLWRKPIPTMLRRRMCN